MAFSHHPRRAVRFHRHMVEIADFAQTIAAECQRVHAIADARLAGVQHVLPAMHGVGVAVGHNHVRQCGAMQNRPTLIAVPIGHLVQHQPVRRMHGDAEVPVLPFDSVASQGEAHAFRLLDGERLGGFPQRRLAGGVIAAVLWRQRHDAVILQMRHAPGGEVHMRDQPLNRAGVAVVRLVLAHETDGAMGAVARRNARVSVAAGGPRVYLHVLEVVDAASPHRRLPAGVRLGDSHRLHHVGEADGRLASVDAAHVHRRGSDVHRGVETAVWRVRVVVAEETQTPGNVVARRERPQRRLGRFLQRHRAERRLGADVRLQQPGGALDLGGGERCQRMRGGFGFARGIHGGVAFCRWTSEAY